MQTFVHCCSNTIANTTKDHDANDGHAAPCQDDGNHGKEGDGDDGDDGESVNIVELRAI